MKLLPKEKNCVVQLCGYIVLRKRVYVRSFFKVVDNDNVSIGRDCSINEGVHLSGRYRTEIGHGVTLSARSMLVDSGLDLESEQRRHVNGFMDVEDGTWIGAGAINLPGVTTGSASFVGAGSVVTREVLDHVVVAGNPDRPIRSLGL